MFGFFKKNKFSVESQLKKMVKNKNIDFQLDVFRNNEVDFQVIRQRQLKNIDSQICIINPDGFAVILSFNLNTQNGLSRFEKFNQSKISNRFTITSKLNSNIDFYFMQCNNDFKEILNCIIRIQKEIYDYKKDTLFYFKYKEI